MRLVIATKNAHKREEIQSLLEELDFEVLDLNQLSLVDDIDETGTTFQENACIKAETISNMIEDIVMADDSGLEIDAFNGEPGIYSARYLGYDTPYAVKNQLILQRMEGNTNRSARFICAIALYQQGKQLFLCEETFEGEISHEVKGVNGFGYDPLFYYPPLNKNSSEMSMEEKNEVSHRGKAMKRLIMFLAESLHENGND